MGTSSFFCDDRIPNLKELSDFRENLETLSDDIKTPIYLLDKALGVETSYSYKDAVILLLPKHVLLVLDRKGSNESKHSSDFEDFFADFVEDLGYLSEKYGYRQWLGRPRDWKRLVQSEFLANFNATTKETLQAYSVATNDERRVELLISLLIGSINDPAKVGVETPTILLDKIKKTVCQRTP